MAKMKPRQYKKLCKKAAEAIGLEDCSVEDGVWQAWFDCSTIDSTEYDSEDAWPFLVSHFNNDVNIMVNHNSECGISWVPDNLIVKATPKNVLAWSRSKFNS